MRTLLCLLALLLAIPAALQADTKLTDGDIFQMSVSGAPREFTQEYELNYTVDDGGVNIPNVGRIKAAGMTATQLAGVIEKELKERKIFISPTVVINVMQTTRSITVGGAVRNPGRHPWNATMTLSIAIATASGPAEFAEDKVRLVRGGKAEVYSRKAIKANPDNDPKILPNDYIDVLGDF